MFFGKFGLLCFLETPASRFTLLPYYRQFTDYNRASSAAEDIGGDFLTGSTKFVDNLQLDRNGNLDCTVKFGVKMHKLHLNKHRKPSRYGISEQIFQHLKGDLTDITQRIIKKPIKDNIEDQCDKNTFYKSWFGLN